MPTLKTTRDPFEVRLSADREKELTSRLAREIEYAISARDRLVGTDGELDQWHLLYEGGKRNQTKNTPWPKAFNLSSFIPTEKVDSLRAQIMATVFVEPIWVVEGWEDSASRAPFVEQLHQWKAEEERLQRYVGRAVHTALIEGTGVLEVYQRSEVRKVRSRELVRVQMDASGLPVLDDDGQPVPVMDEAGNLMAPSDDTASAALVVDKLVTFNRGPQYRVLSLRDFYILPGHAAELQDVWGYAKRVYRLLADLRQREAEGIYRHVDELGLAGEREQLPHDERKSQDIPPQHDVTAEKPIWEVSFFDDLDGDGFREWYVATLHLERRVLLRLQYDDTSSPRYVLFRPFPREDAIYGYSLVGNKLLSVSEEHASWRNMTADRAALVNAAPLKRVVGSPWDPDLTPFGPRQIIDVRDSRDVEAMQIPDVPSSVIRMMESTIRAAERISGQNDTTSGVLTEEERTLGEVQIVTRLSLNRIGEAVKNVQEGMEDLFKIRHEMWKAAFADQPEPIPSGVLSTLEAQGVVIPTTQATAALMEGVFRGKPRGSVETADPTKLRGEFVSFLTSLTQLSQAIPAMAQHLNRPDAVRSILNQAVRLYNWQDRQALLGPATAPRLPELAPPALPAAPPEPDTASSPLASIFGAV